MGHSSALAFAVAHVHLRSEHLSHLFSCYGEYVGDVQGLLSRLTGSGSSSTGYAGWLMGEETGGVGSGVCGGLGYAILFRCDIIIDSTCRDCDEWWVLGISIVQSSSSCRFVADAASLPLDIRKSEPVEPTSSKSK